MKKKCKWVRCWFSSITVPGNCVNRRGDMQNPNCPEFLDEKDKLAKWEQEHKKMKENEEI